MPAKKNVVSSSTAGPSGKNAFGQSYSGKPTDKLKKREFGERFCFPNDISVQLVDGDAMTTEKAAHNTIYFSKEQFNTGLRFPLPSLFKASQYRSGVDGVQYPKLFDIFNIFKKIRKLLIS